MLYKCLYTYKLTTYLATSERSILSMVQLKSENSVAQLKFMLLYVFFHILVPAIVALIAGTMKTVNSPF